MAQQQILGSQAVKDNSVTPAKLTFTPLTSTQLGAANGVASLDAGGKIPAAGAGVQWRCNVHYFLGE